MRREGRSTEGEAMAKYLIVETRDPFDSADVRNMYDLAQGLADENEVTVFLVQNGVLPVRKASASAAERITKLAQKATVLADDFSLRERGITPGEITQGVKAAAIEKLVDLVVEDGRKVIWH